MNHRRTAAQHQSDAINAFMSGALTNPHLPAERTEEQARKVLPWLARETDTPIDWEITPRTSGGVMLTGRITDPDPQARRRAIQAWADVIGSWSISDRDDRMEAIGMYQGFSVEVTSTP